MLLFQFVIVGINQKGIKTFIRVCILPHKCRLKKLSRVSADRDT
jgi:hypothetical protein